MKTTSFYLFKITTKIITQAMLWVILIIALTDWSSQAAKISATYSWQSAMLYVALMMPTRLQLAMPLIFLISGLMLIIQMKKTQELTAIQILGGSIWHITKVLFMSSAFIIILCLIITEGIGPECLLKAKQLRSGQKQQPLLLTTNGLWWWEKSENNASFNHIKSVNEDGSLNNILILHPETNTYKIQTITLAKKAVFKDKHWVLQDTTTIATDNGKRVITKAINIHWHITPLIIKALAQQDRMLSLIKLYKRWQFAKYSMSENAKSHEFNLLHRILNPIYTILCFLFLWACSNKSISCTRNKYKILKLTSFGLMIYILDVLTKPLIILFPNQLIILSLLPILSLLSIIGLLNFKPKLCKNKKQLSITTRAS